MARPRKPASLKKGKSETKAQLEIRAQAEADLLGNTDLLGDAPVYLDDLAQEYYRFLLTELQISSLLSNLDIPLLEQTSDCLSKLRKSDEIINREGLIIYTQDRYGGEQIKEHPAVSTKQKYLNQFRALSTQLGLSPASRAQLAGMQIEQKDNEEDPLLKVLRGEI